MPHIDISDFVGDLASKADKDVVIALQRILGRIKADFKGNSLEIRFKKSTGGQSPPTHCFYICAVWYERVLWFFKVEKSSRIVALWPVFYSSVVGKNVINCTVYDRSVMSVVRQELKTFAEEKNASLLIDTVSK